MWIKMPKWTIFLISSKVSNSQSKEVVLITEIFWRIFWRDNWRSLIVVVGNFRFKCSTTYHLMSTNMNEWYVYFGLFYATYFYLSAHLHMASCILFSDTFIHCMILAINLISTFIIHIALHYYYVLQSRTIFVLK